MKFLFVLWSLGTSSLSLRVDFSESFSLTYNENVCRSPFCGLHTGVGDKNIPEFKGDSNGHFQDSLECAEGSLELSTVRTLAERVLPCDEHNGVAEDDVEDDSLAFSWDRGRALSIESEAGALGIFDGTWQDGSEDAGQFRHDEGGPEQLRFRFCFFRDTHWICSTTGTSERVCSSYEGVCGVREGACDPRERACHTIKNSCFVFHEFLLVPKKRHFVSAVGQKMLGTPHVHTSWSALSGQPTSVLRSRCQVPLSWACVAFQLACLSP